MTGYIPEEKISEVRNAAEIVDVVAETVLLKKAGKNFVGLCPFHTEKTPSFTVSPDKQMFHCFGCGTGGSVFTFLMRLEGLSFPEAVEQLARRYGITMPPAGSDAQSRRNVGGRERLFDVNRQALEYFRRMLLKDPAGKPAQRYLERRGIRPETVDAFQLGYAPAGWGNLTGHFRRQLPVEVLQKAGLIVASERTKGYYDRFRSRLIFPIIDPQMRILGFGGRVLDDSLPKYLNSPETPIYNKGRVLYGLHRTRDRCRSTGMVFIVEGYLDLLALYQNGIQNVVATLGTALTAEHVQLLRRYAECMVLVYDSDEAGLRSAQRCVEVFWQSHVDFRRNDVFREEGADTRIMVLPAGHDPDTFLQAFGPEDFRQRAAAAPGIVTFLMEQAVQAHGLSVEGKIRVVHAMLAPLSAINDRIAQSLYVKKLSERIDLDENTIWAQLKDLAGAQSAARSEDPNGKRRVIGQTGVPPALPGNRFERQIIAMMLQFPDILPEVETAQVLGSFESKSLRQIGDLILSRPGASPAELAGILADGPAAQLLAALALEEESWTMAGCRRLLAQFVQRRLTRRRRADLEAQIKAAEESDDQEALMALLREKQKMATRLTRQRSDMLRDE